MKLQINRVLAKDRQQILRLLTVNFAEPEDFPINVVGRIGFLYHLQIGLIDYEKLLYLSLMKFRDTLKVVAVYLRHTLTGN